MKVFSVSSLQVIDLVFADQYYSETDILLLAWPRGAVSGGNWFWEPGIVEVSKSVLAYRLSPPYEKRIISRCDIICDIPDVKDVESVTLRMSHPLDVTSREVTLCLDSFSAARPFL